MSVTAGSGGASRLKKMRDVLGEQLCARARVEMSAVQRDKSGARNGAREALGLCEQDHLVVARAQDQGWGRNATEFRGPVEGKQHTDASHRN